MPNKKSRQQRRAEERARVRKPQRQSRRRLALAVACVGLVLAVIAGLVVVRLMQNRGVRRAAASGRAPAAVVNTVSHLPKRVFDKVGYQKTLPLPTRITGAPLRQDGKPTLVYVGAEYCPYCAAERWAIVAALSRFGTFHDLGATHSSSTDIYPDTATFSFHGATYTSRYLTLDAAEIYSNQPLGSGYAPLDPPTPLEQELSSRYDSGGSIPFIDIGNRYMLSGASYNPQLLEGLSMLQIAAALRDPSTPLCRSILGTANAVTAAICTQTNGEPANVCSSAAVTTVASRLNG